MKKIMKKLGILLAAVLVAAAVLTACGGGGNSGNSGGEETKGFDLPGKYTATLNMKDYINKGMEASGMAFENDMNANMYLELKDDGTFTLEMIGSELASIVSEAMQEEGPNLIKTLLSAQGISEDQFEELVAASGYESFDAFVEDMLSQVDEELESSLENGIENQMKAEGNYKAEGDTITFSGEGMAVDKGTIGSDGSITLKMSTEGMDDVELVFKK